MNLFTKTVIITIAAILSFVLFFAIFNINLNKTYPPLKLQEVVVMEALVNQSAKPSEATTDLADNFCKYYNADESEVKLNDACGKLTRGNCMNTKCCVWAKDVDDEKCYSGGPHGQTFKTDNQGKTIQSDYYYYMNKCYGKCDNKNLI